MNGSAGAAVMVVIVGKASEEGRAYSLGTRANRINMRLAKAGCD